MKFVTVESSNAPQSTRTVFRLGGSVATNKWITIVICVIVGVVLLNLAATIGNGRRPDPAAQFFSVVVGVVVLGIGLYLGYVTWTTRLVFSPEGLEYNWGSGALRAAWREVASVVQSRTYEGRGAYRTFDALTLTSQTGVIDLSQFDVNWRDGELGEDLKQYAPWLFANAPASPPADEGGR